MSTELIPTHRCTHCTLVRCYWPGTTCQECCVNIAASFGAVGYVPVPETIIDGACDNPPPQVRGVHSDGKTAESCRTKFVNIGRFTSEPYIPQLETAVYSQSNNHPLYEVGCQLPAKDTTTVRYFDNGTLFESRELKLE